MLFMNRRNLVGAIFFGFLSTIALSAVPEKRSPSRYGVPKLRPGELWVSSIPVGLEVRVGEFPKGKAIGRTPLVLKASDVGQYVTVTLSKAEAGGNLPDQMKLADFTYARTHTNGWKEEHTGRIVELDRAITYKVRLPMKQTVIALFQAKDVPIRDLARLYPPGLNFRFSDEIVRKSLEQRGVSREIIRTGMPLLHRGGKIAVPSKEGWLVVEAGASDLVELFDEKTGPPL